MIRKARQIWKYYMKNRKTPANWTWLADRVDKNGKRFWFDWGEQIDATDIDSPDAIKLLPEKITNLYSKWVKDLEDMKNKEGGLFFFDFGHSVISLFANWFANR